MAEEASENFWGCVALIGLGLALWLAYDNLPISAYSIAAGLAALGLRRAEKVLDGEDPASISFRRRLARGVASDGRRIAFWLFAGFAAIWVVQIVINLFRSHTDPDQVLSAEVAVYEFGERLAQLASVSTALICLAIALLLSILVSALWPVAALGALRKFLAAAIVAFAAIASFSFVAVAEASSRYDFATGPIRAAIVQDLAQLAQARRDGAAFQWMAAQFSPERREAQPAIREWRAYFNEAEARCEQENVEFRRAYRGQLRQAMANAPPDDGLAQVRRSGAPSEVPTYCRPDELVQNLVERRTLDARGAAVAARPWLADFGADLGPPAMGELDTAVGDLTLDARTRRLYDLQSLRATVGAALGRAGAARDAARTIAVDAIANLLPGNARGAAGVIVDAWKGVLVEALAGETGSRIAMRIALLRTRAPVSAGNAEMLAETHSPLGSPLAGREGPRTIEAAIDAELGSLDRPAPAVAAAEAVTRHIEPISPHFGGTGIDRPAMPFHPTVPRHSPPPIRIRFR